MTKSALDACLQSQLAIKILVFPRLYSSSKWQKASAANISRKNPLKHFVPPQNVLVVYGTNGFGEMFSDEHEHSESDNEHDMNMD